MNSTPHRRPELGGQTGVTLIELLVAIAGMLAVLYIVYNVYDATQTAATSMTRRQSAVDFAVRVVDEAGEIVTGAVEPSNLDGPADIRVSFEKNTFTVPAYRGDKGIRLVSVGAVEEGESVSYSITDAALALTPGEPSSASIRSLGGKAEDFVPEVTFRYALESNPASPVAYVDSVPEGQWPVLIEVSVVVRTDPKDPQSQPIELRTAFIPGGLPKSAAAPAAPESALPPEPAPEVQIP